MASFYDDLEQSPQGERKARLLSLYEMTGNPFVSGSPYVAPLRRGPAGASGAWEEPEPPRFAPPSAEAPPLAPQQAASDVLRGKPAAAPRRMAPPAADADTSLTSIPTQGAQAAPGAGADRRPTIRDEMRKLDELMKTPDMTEAADAYRQRYESAGPDMILGMALADRGGRSGRDFGGQIFKQALARRQPEKTDYGTLDASGFTADPMKEREYNISRAEKKIAMLETMAQHAQTSEDRRAIAQATLEARREIAGMMAASKGEGRSHARDAAVDRVGGQVMDDYIKSIKDERSLMTAYDNLNATAKRTDAGSDLSFIFQYMKMLDPGSVVREGEFATAQNSAGIPDRIRNLYNRAMKGERLNPVQREQFLATAGRLATAADERMEMRRREFAPRLRAVGAEPAIYLPGWRVPAPAAEPAAGGRGTANSPIRVTPRAPSKKDAGRDDATLVEF